MRSDDDSLVMVLLQASRSLLPPPNGFRCHLNTCLANPPRPSYVGICCSHSFVCSYHLPHSASFIRMSGCSRHNRWRTHSPTDTRGRHGIQHSHALMQPIRHMRVRYDRSRLEMNTGVRMAWNCSSRFEASWHRQQRHTYTWR